MDKKYIIASSVICIFIVLIIIYIYFTTCKGEYCENLVDLGDWILIPQIQTDKSGFLSRKCTNKKFYVDACSKIAHKINKTFDWTGTSECNKICGNGTFKKNFVFNDVTYWSSNFTCTKPNCNYINAVDPEYGSIFGLFNNQFYRSPPGYYDYDTGLFNRKFNIITKDDQNIDHIGLWVQVEFPTSVIINKYRFARNDYDNIIEWVVLGSNNGTSWKLLDNRNDSINNIFTIDNNNPYKFYRIIVKKIISGEKCQTTLFLTNFEFNNF